VQQDTRSRIPKHLPGAGGAVLGCTLVVTITAVAGRSSNREAAIGAAAFLAAIVVAGLLTRIRYRARVAEIERLATRDPLTGLANRRVLDETLPREIARSRRTLTPLSAIVVDVDHFKGVNDRHGHQTGDAVLRSVGATLEQNTKGYDVVVRLGGDEFAVLLPGCSAPDAAQVAERLLLRTVVEAHGHPVTISAGHATLTPEMADGAALLAAADAGLYAAKRAGRSRAATVQDVVLAPDPLEPAALHHLDERWSS
jgi:diguanylate cyclase (GGDEF)-like protein